MSIIDDRLDSSFSDATNKIKGLEAKLVHLDVLGGSVAEMKGCIKETFDRLDTSTLEYAGTDASPRTLSDTNHRRVDSNAACLPTKAH